MSENYPEVNVENAENVNVPENSTDEAADSAQDDSDNDNDK